MSYENIIYEKRGKIAYITLNRPEVLNALNTAMHDEIRSALADFDSDDDVWVAILSGNGKAFSAGGDKRQLGAKRPATSNPDIYFLNNPVNWKPVIAAVQGYCYGYALSLAAECDAIVASDDAAFCLIETRLGMLPVTIFAHLSAWMGSKRLTEMIMTAEPLSGADAYRLGLVNRLVASPDELLPAAEALAEQILLNPPLAVRAAVQLSRTAALGSPIHREAEIVYRNTRWFEWDDYREGLSARREGRQPEFRGR